MIQNLKMPRGVMQAPVTPLTDSFEVDLDTLEKLVNWHTETDRNIGIVALYNKAEPLSLSIDERKAIARVTIQTVAGRLPVLVHVGHPSTDIALELAKHAESLGAFGVVCIQPYYWAPSEAGLRRHFEVLLQSVDIGVLAYNSPWRVEGPSISPELALDLSRKYRNFIGLKDASFDMDYISEVCRLVLDERPDFAFFVGVEYLLGSVVLGGSGSFSAVGAVAPRMVYDLWDAIDEERWDDAHALQHRVSHFHQHFKDYYPAGLKVAMEIMGRPVGPCRLPIPSGDESMRAKIEQTLTEYGVLEDESHGW